MENAQPAHHLDTTGGLLEVLYTDAGIVPVMLAIACMFLVWLWWKERVDHKAERAAHIATIEKLYSIGSEVTKQMAIVTTTLDKVYQVFVSK